MATRGLHTILLSSRGLGSSEIPGLCFLIEEGPSLKTVNLSSNFFTSKDIELLLLAVSQSGVETVDLTGMLSPYDQVRVPSVFLNSSLIEVDL